MDEVEPIIVEKDSEAPDIEEQKTTVLKKEQMTTALEQEPPDSRAPAHKLEKTQAYLVENVLAEEVYMILRPELKRHLSSEMKKLLTDQVYKITVEFKNILASEIEEITPCQFERVSAHGEVHNVTGEKIFAPEAEKLLRHEIKKTLAPEMINDPESEEFSAIGHSDLCTPLSEKGLGSDIHVLTEVKSEDEQTISVNKTEVIEIDLVSSDEEKFLVSESPELESVEKLTLPFTEMLTYEIDEVVFDDPLVDEIDKILESREEPYLPQNTEVTELEPQEIRSLYLYTMAQ